MALQQLGRAIVERAHVSRYDLGRDGLGGAARRTSPPTG